MSVANPKSATIAYLHPFLSFIKQFWNKATKFQIKPRKIDVHDIILLNSKTVYSSSKISDRNYIYIEVKLHLPLMLNPCV